MIQPIRVLATFIIGFCIEGIVCSVVYGKSANALLALASLTLIYVIVSQLTKQYLLIQKKQLAYMIFLIAWIFISVYYLVMALAFLIYFSELQQKQIIFDNHLLALMIYQPSLPFNSIIWINLTFYFGNAISIGFYTRSYYRIFWVDHIVHIYRYLKKRVRNLNESLLSNLPVINFIQQLKSAHCSLCLQEYDPIQPITKLNCSHYYHRNCIRIWVMKSNACPLCRRRVIF